jgi:hypothetical protein
MTDCARTARRGPENRSARIAAILATGLLRLESRAALPTNECHENPRKTLAEGLELSRQTRLSVRCG